MKRTAFLLVLLLVSACAPVASGPTSVVYDPNVPPQEAQRILDRATNTAAAVATAAAVSTAVRADALASATAEWAATSQAISIQSTQAAAQWTATAAAISAQRTEGAATLEADATRGAATQRAVGTATEQIIQAEKRAADQRMETMRAEAYFWGGLLFLAGLTILLLFGFAAVLTAGESFLLAVARDRYATAATRGIIVLADGRSYDALAGQVIDGQARALPEPEEPPQVIPVHGHRAGQIARTVTPAERLLTAAVRKGYGASSAIPSAAVLGWGGEARQSAVNSLRGYVTVRMGAPVNGGGTFITGGGYRTCAELLNAIKRSEITPALLEGVPVEVGSIAQTHADT